jgi:uncharacterized protein YodC (DUF2158 family)
MSNLVVLRGFLPEFPIGATVRLKSGGPIMTVTAIQDRNIEVQWFEKGIGKQRIMPSLCFRRVVTRRFRKAS